MAKNPFTEIYRRLATLERRLDNLFTVGKVSEANYNTGVVRINDGAGNESAKVPWVGMKSKGVTHHDAPEIDQKMIVINNGQNAFALMGGFSNDGQKNGNNPKVTRTDFADGASFEYNQSSGAMNINLTNSLTIIIGGITISASGSTIAVTGADIILPSNDVVAKGHSLDNHKHPDVMKGPATTGSAIP